jgi:hypothetical protein
MALLVGAGLLLSGCWANVYNYSANERYITLTKDLSDRLIYSCTAEQGTGAARAFCALDKINGVCFHFPEKGISSDDCTALSNYGDWEDLDRAIKAILAPGSHYACLSFDEVKNLPGASDSWNVVGPVGAFGCQ